MSVPEQHAEKSLLCPAPFRRVTAEADRFQIELIDEDEHAFDPRAHRTDRHGGAADVDDVPIDPHRIQDRLAFVLIAEALLADLDAPCFAKYEQLDTGHAA